MTISKLRYSGILAIGLLWSVVIWGMWSSGLKLIDDRPISYLGISSSTALIFNLVLFISAVLFSLFGMFLYRKFKLSKLFLIVFLIGQVAQMIAALYQYGGEDKRIHTIAAFTIAVAIPTYMLFFALSKNLGEFKKQAFIFYVIESVFFLIGIGAFIFAKGISPLAEILPALPFHAWVIYLTMK